MYLKMICLAILLCAYTLGAESGTYTLKEIKSMNGKMISAKDNIAIKIIGRYAEIKTYDNCHIFIKTKNNLYTKRYCTIEEQIDDGFIFL